MNKFVEVMSFIGGANLDILKKCPTAKNGFIATGIGILNVVILSMAAMWLIFCSAIKNNIILTLITSVFYGFIIFIGYWGILSVIRKTVKYNAFIKVFSFLATIIFAFIATMAAKNLVPILNIQNVSMANKSVINRYFNIGIVFLVMLFIYIIPVILKLLINSSTYEEEKERMEHNFIAQKEADIIAYKQKYGDYALVFNDANIKMESIKHLSDLSEEYHGLLEKIQKDTFDYLNKIEKSNANQKNLLEDCKSNVENQFKLILEKMSKIFSSI
jgi:lysylphosphatidylglycerol synthetase-like protein (DUF2156 family)